MALIRPLTVDGVQYPTAYSRIVTVRCDKRDAYIYVCTYADEEARLRDDYPVQSEEHITRLAELSGDLYPRSYAFLKTLPGFALAVDHVHADPADPQPEEPTEVTPIIEPPLN